MKKGLIILFIIIGVLVFFEIGFSFYSIFRKDIDEYELVSKKNVPNKTTPIEIEELNTNLALDKYCHHIKKYERVFIYNLMVYETHLVLLKYDAIEYNNIKEKIIKCKECSDAIFYDYYSYHISLNLKNRTKLKFIMSNEYISINNINLIAYSDDKNTILFMSFRLSSSNKYETFGNLDDFFERYFNEIKKL